MDCVTRSYFDNKLSILKDKLIFAFMVLIIPLYAKLFGLI